MSDLVSHVHVFDEHGEPAVFSPEDDEIPEWAASQMGAHCFTDGKHPFPDSDYPGKPEKTAAKAAASK
jgi:hypothetical protein